MTVSTRLLTRDRIERHLFRPAASIRALDPAQEIGICPVVELLEIGELVKKGKMADTVISFRSGLQAFLEGPVCRGEVFVVNLDQSRLADVLFDREDHLVVGLWPTAGDCEPGVAPAHSVRRLLLRPSDQNWWDSDIYREAEAIYQIGKDAGTHSDG